MGFIKYVLFDCMETLIDLDELPALEDYASWAYTGSGVEDYWGGFHDFLKYYKSARASMEQSEPPNKEYEMLERLRFATHQKLSKYPADRINHIAERLYSNYWKNYKSRAYVKKDVLAVLPKLTKRFKLGVVSNFMVPGGIQELLEMTQIDSYFDFVVTSIDVGYRKPDQRIFEVAIEKTGVSAQEIAFIGDDYRNDFEGARQMGMRAVLLDRFDSHAHVQDRIGSFFELR